MTALTLTYEQRSLLADGTHWFDSHLWVTERVLERRCANDPCPSCDGLPGGWDGWCVRCGLPHENGATALCSHCDRELFWRELFW